MTREEKNQRRGPLVDKIFCLTFEKPRSGYEISNIIYGRDIRIVRDTLKHYQTKGYFEQVTFPEERFPRWRATTKPILEIIDERTTLYPREADALKNIIDDESFRSLIEYKRGYNSIEKIVNLMANFAIIINITDKYRKYKHGHPEKTRQELMKEFKKKTTEDERLKNMSEYGKIAVKIFDGIFPKVKDLVVLENQRKNLENISEKIVLLDDEILNKLIKSSYESQLILHLMTVALVEAEMVNVSRKLRN
jgi:hypothetical protein